MPTVVSVVQEEVDCSIVYSFTEEEIQKEVKEVKAGLQEDYTLHFFTVSKEPIIIKSANLEKHDNVSGEICSPPPEFI
jgi:hypothetical protein